MGPHEKKSEIWCEENLVCGQLTVQIATFFSKISASRFSPSYHANAQNPTFFAKGHVLTPVEKRGMVQGPEFLQTDTRLVGLNITKIAALYSTPLPPEIGLNIQFNTIHYSVVIFLKIKESILGKGDYISSKYTSGATQRLLLQSSSSSRFLDIQVSVHVYGRKKRWKHGRPGRNKGITFFFSKVVCRNPYTKIKIF